MIQTYSGELFNPLAADGEDCGPIRLFDIAHALSNLCRFNGHVKRFYSVGEHSLYVSALLDSSKYGNSRELQRWGLMHDAAEAYLGDMVRPIKQKMPEFEAIEDRLLRRIAGRFGLVWPIPPEVFDADEIMLATEFRDLKHSMPKTPLKMPPSSLVIPLRREPSESVRDRFLRTADNLGLK